MISTRKYRVVVCKENRLVAALKSIFKPDFSLNLTFQFSSVLWVTSLQFPDI